MVGTLLDSINSLVDDLLVIIKSKNVCKAYAWNRDFGIETGQCDMQNKELCICHNLRD